jgi:type IV pilus assembly protein PilE
MRRKIINLAAFTLTELLIVLIIVGILMLMAIPRFMPLITRAKSTEARLALGHLHMLQQNYHYMSSRYCDDLEELGFEQELLASDGGQANYRIEILNAGEHGFIAQAVAVIDFDGDGQFNVWEIDEGKNLNEKIKD